MEQVAAVIAMIYYKYIRNIVFDEILGINTAKTVWKNA